MTTSGVAKWTELEPLTEEEDAFITERALQDPDNPPLTDEEFAQFQPVRLDPEFLTAAEAHRRALEALPEWAELKRDMQATWDAAMAAWREEKRAAAEAEETERRRRAV